MAVSSDALKRIRSGQAAVDAKLESIDRGGDQSPPATATTPSRAVAVAPGTIRPSDVPEQTGEDSVGARRKVIPADGPARATFASPRARRDSGPGPV